MRRRIIRLDPSDLDGRTRSFLDVVCTGRGGTENTLRSLDGLVFAYKKIVGFEKELGFELHVDVDEDITLLRKAIASWAGEVTGLGALARVYWNIPVPPASR